MRECPVRLKSAYAAFIGRRVLQQNQSEAGRSVVTLNTTYNTKYPTRQKAVNFVKTKVFGETLKEILSKRKDKLDVAFVQLKIPYLVFTTLPVSKNCFNCEWVLPNWKVTKENTILLIRPPICSSATLRLKPFADSLVSLFQGFSSWYGLWHILTKNISLLLTLMCMI